MAQAYLGLGKKDASDRAEQRAKALATMVESHASSKKKVGRARATKISRALITF
jgi:hypothetical protein